MNKQEISKGAREFMKSINSESASADDLLSGMTYAATIILGAVCRQQDFADTFERVFQTLVDSDDLLFPDDKEKALKLLAEVIDMRTVKMLGKQ